MFFLGDNIVIVIVNILKNWVAKLTIPDLPGSKSSSIKNACPVTKKRASQDKDAELRP